MGEKIKLPTALARAVWKSLEKKGITPRKNGIGWLDESFTQEELDQVTGIELVNYTEGIKGISHLRNLKYLSIDTTQISAYTSKRELYSLTDQDIWEIEKLENLEHLVINNQREISAINISGFKNLKTLEITRCQNLEEIKGLAENRTLSEVVIYDVNSISRIKNLDKFIEHNQNLEVLELDVLLYPSAIGYSKSGAYNENASKTLDSLTRIKWTESVEENKTSINHSQMKKMHEKAVSIVKKYCTSDFEIEKVVAINEYIARNIKYNYSALKDPMRWATDNGKVVGPVRGATGENGKYRLKYNKALELINNL